METSGVSLPGSPGKLIITSPDEPEREYVITTPIVRVGRAPEPQNDLVLSHSWVSRAHLRLYCDRLPLRVQDLRSSNGTALNDVPLPAEEIRELKDGDVLSIGPFRLKLVLAAQSEAEPPGEPSASETANAEQQVEQALAALHLQQAPKIPVAPPPQFPQQQAPAEQPPERWVGVPSKASRWLQYLPSIYAEDEFLGRFLLLFEDMLGPIEQIIYHFDLFLDARTAPGLFLPWLDFWLAEITDESWPESVRREIIQHASWIYEMRGTRAGLVYLLKTCTGCEVDIRENEDGPHTFRVIVHQKDKPVDLRLIERIIELNRPAHTCYQVDIE